MSRCFVGESDRGLGADSEVRQLVEEELYGQLVTRDMMDEIKAVQEERAWICTEKRRMHTLAFSCCGYTCDEYDLGQYGLIYGVQVKHGSVFRCPRCNHMVKGQTVARIAEGAVDEAYHFFYRRMDSGDLAVIGLWAGKRWGYYSKMGSSIYEMAEVPLEVNPTEIVILSRTAATRRYIHRLYEYFGDDLCWYYEGWQKRKTAREKVQGTGIHPHAIDYYRHDANLADQLNDLEQHTLAAIQNSMTKWRGDYIDVLKRTLREPGIEYLLRMGLNDLAYPTLDWQRKLVHTQKTKPTEILPLDSNELARLRDSGVQLKSWMLIVPHAARKLKQPIKLERGMECVRRIVGGASEYRCGILFDMLMKHGKRLGLSAMLRYIHRLKGDELGDWSDYLRMLEDLEPETRDGKVIYPKDPKAAHAEMAMHYKNMKAEIFAEKVAQAAAGWAKDYTFQACGLILSPFETPTEITAEGMVQHICIGSYVESYARRRTILCKLRRVEEPDKPFHAVEFALNGKMVQCRGAYNQTLVEDVPLVKAFWEAWQEAHDTEFEVNLTERRTA